MKRIIKYTSFILLIFIALLLLLNQKIIYALTNFNSFTDVEGISYFDAGEKMDVQSMSAFGGIIIYVDNNNEVLAINVLNPDNTEIEEYRIGDTCADTMEYNTEITSTEENAHTYGCNTIYKKENTNIKDVKKWKSILEYGDVYDLEYHGSGTTMTEIGSYIENEFYTVSELEEYLNNNGDFNYYNYLENETINLCDNYSDVFPESLECDEGSIRYNESTDDNSYGLIIGNGWYWSNPVYVFKEVVEPIFSLECDKLELSKGEETTCIIKINTTEKMTNIETELKIDSLEIKNTESLNSWTIIKDENKIKLINTEGTIGEKEVIKVTLINNENVKKNTNITLSNISYTDESGTSNYDDLKQELTLIHTEENPDTSDITILICIIIILISIITTYLSVYKISKTI